MKKFHFVMIKLWRALRAARLYARYMPLRRRLMADPKTKDYRDLALSRVTDTELEELELFTATRPALTAVQRASKPRVSSVSQGYNG